VPRLYPKQFSPNAEWFVFKGDLKPPRQKLHHYSRFMLIRSHTVIKFRKPSRREVERMLRRIGLGRTAFSALGD
jgi:hypothetical protein